MPYDNNFTGRIGKNDRKEKDTHPDIKGDCEIDGVEYWVNGWRTMRKDGSGHFYQLRFNRKQEAKSSRAPAKAKPSQGSGFDDMQNDVPW
jgi:hypothetical protein